MGRKANTITLTEEQRSYLELQTRARTIQAQTVCRARILLLRADGVSINDDLIEKIEKIEQIEARARERAQSANLKSNSNIEADITNVEIQLDRIKHLKKSIYEDYKAGLLTKEEFIDYKADYDKQEVCMNELIKKMKDSGTSEEEALLESDFVKTIKGTPHVTELTRCILENFYEKIIIYEDHRIKFKYKFGEVVEAISKY